MKLKKGKTYRLSFPTDNVIVAKLVDIWDYPSAGLPPDYFFKWISGDLEDMCKEATIPEKGGFPLPEFLIQQTKIEVV